MSKNVKIVIAGVLVILVIILCCVTFGKNKNEKDNSNGNTVTNETSISESNTMVENETIDNTVVNEVEDEEPIIENVTKVEPQGTVYESNSDAGTTDKKQEAIDLVKQTWGEDDTVTFRCDSVGENGEYIIAVVSKQTASVKNYFKVNLNTKTVDIDY